MHRTGIPSLIATSLFFTCGVGCEQQAAEHGPQAAPAPAVSTRSLQAAVEQPVAAPLAESSATITTATLPPPPASKPRVVAARSAATPAMEAPAPAAQASATSAPAAKKASQGATVSGEGFATWLQSVGEYAAGKPGQVLLVLESKAPYKCNAEYPYKFTFAAAPKGVSYPSAVVREAAIDKKKATLTLPIAPSAAGEATIAGTFNFSVCTEERCLVEKRELSLTIQIQ